MSVKDLGGKLVSGLVSESERPPGQGGSCWVTQKRRGIYTYTRVFETAVIRKTVARGREQSIGGGLGCRLSGCCMLLLCW